MRPVCTILIAVVVTTLAERVIPSQYFHYCTDGHGRYAYTPEDFVLPAGWRLATAQDRITTPLVTLVTRQVDPTYPDGTVVVTSQICTNITGLQGWGGFNIPTLQGYGDITVSGSTFTWYHYGTSNIAIRDDFSGVPQQSPALGCTPFTGKLLGGGSVLAFTGYVRLFTFADTSNGFTACGMRWNPPTRQFVPNPASSSVGCRVGLGVRYSPTDYTLFMLHNDVGSSRVDLQACKLEYSIVSPK